MCIICVSKSGVQQPTDSTIRAMFRRNPHGAGYMYARDGKVTIHKGFMNIEDFLSAVHTERFTPQDSVVYHFRISTQAGVNAAMTHPFPLSNQPRMRALNKAVIRRWYSVASASVTRSGCENAYPSRKPGFTGSATRKPRSGCYGQLNRRGKRIASLARIQSRFHATLYSFPERVRRISTGSLQPLQYAIRWIENPQRKGKTAFPCIGGSV